MVNSLSYTNRLTDFQGVFFFSNLSLFQKKKKSPAAIKILVHVVWSKREDFARTCTWKWSTQFAGYVGL